MARSSLRQAVRIGLALLALVGLGEAGHQLFERIGWEQGHHAFHLAYGAGAIVAFVAFAVRDLRRNGMPRFAWALRPEAGTGSSPE